MKTIKPMSLGILHRPIEFQRRFFLGIASTMFCPMDEAPGILGELAMWKFLATILPPEIPLDMALPKTAAEFLVSGSAFSPSGQPVRAVPVSVQLGSLTKRLMAVGDRHIEDGRATEPVPFVEMPMGWDRAYGGPKVPENPLGRGTAEMPLQGIGYGIPLPNVVEADRSARATAPVPLNFGPMDIAWPQRSKLAGTHDARWLEEDFPGFARDIDWRMLMAASPDQRFPGYLRGDEAYTVENMHPTQPLLTGRLPGVTPRIFIERKGGSGLEEVQLNLTTVWFFPNAKRLVMIHHGRVRLAEEDARDIVRMVQGCDPIGAPRPVAEFAEVLVRRLDPKFGALEAMRDSALVPSALIVPDPDIEASKAQLATDGLVQKRLRRRKELEIERDRERVRALGLDPEKYGMPALPPDEPEPTLETLPARIEAAEKEAEAKRIEGEAFIAAQMEQLNQTLAALGLPKQEPAERKLTGPPRFSASGKRQELEEIALLLESQGQDASIVRNQLGDAAAMESWDKAEESVRDGYRQGAHEQNPVPRLGAAANAALRAWLLDGRREAKRADCCGADLSGVDLSGMDLSESWFDGADLSGANLTRARLDRAVLAHANLEGARLAGVRLKEANLGRAVLRRADLSGAILHATLLHNADLTGASFRRADLSDAHLHENQLASVDFSDVVAHRLFIANAKIEGLVAIGADLDGAMFVTCELAGADFSNAKLRQVTFIAAKAPGIRFTGADLTKCVFVEACELPGADFTGARCEAVNMRGAIMPGAVFTGAFLDGADLSDCDLRETMFDLVRARNARFTVTSLVAARLTRADFKGASFARADLRGADLSDSSLFEVDLGRILADSTTRYERIQRTRTKLVPRRTPPVAA